MEAIDRWKRRVVARLLGEVDITYFEKAIDHKIAKLVYKDREIIVEKRDEGYVLFLRRINEYTYNQEYYANGDQEMAMEEAKRVIKADEEWQ